MDQQEAQRQAIHMMMAIFPVIAVFIVIGLVLYIIPLWRICTRAGLAGPLSLIALIPGVGRLVVLYLIAFMEWKVVPAPTASPYYPSNYPPPPPPAYQTPPQA